MEFWAAIVLDFAEVPANMFTSMFTCARTGGWSAHILEQKRTGRLIRPSAIYTGPATPEGQRGRRLGRGLGGLSFLPCPSRPTTPRMSLVPVSDEHLDLLVGLNSDPSVMRYILGRAATPDETRAEWERRRGRQSDEARGLGYWIGFADGEFVGWFSASSFADDPAVSGIGYRLRRSAWGRGFATEGATATLTQAFAVPGVERVLASTMAVNAESRRVLEKLGMRHVDTYVGEWRDPIEGWEEGEVVYALTRAEADLRPLTD